MEEDLKLSILIYLLHKINIPMFGEIKLIIPIFYQITLYSKILKIIHTVLQILR
jgi:hypothetical protein